MFRIRKIGKLVGNMKRAMRKAIGERRPPADNDDHQDTNTRRQFNQRPGQHSQQKPHQRPLKDNSGLQLVETLIKAVQDSNEKMILNLQDTLRSTLK